MASQITPSVLHLPLHSGGGRDLSAVCALGFSLLLCEWQYQSVGGRETAHVKSWHMGTRKWQRRYDSLLPPGLRGGAGKWPPLQLFSLECKWLNLLTILAKSALGTQVGFRVSVTPFRVPIPFMFIVWVVL